MGHICIDDRNILDISYLLAEKNTWECDGLTLKHNTCIYIYI